MQEPSFDTQIFEKEWIELSKKICERIYAEPSIQEMKSRFQSSGIVSSQDRSDFITVANSVKNRVIAELFGPESSEEHKKFKEAWQHWFNTKTAPRFQLENRKLTNAEHIVYSSTPSPEEFWLMYRVSYVLITPMSFNILLLCKN